MTNHMKRTKDALDKFQEEMNEYGLKVNRSTSGHFSADSTRYVLMMMTEAVEVKGNKELIERLKVDGWAVQKYSRRDMKGVMYYVFIVKKVVHIERRPDDAEEYQEPAGVPEETEEKAAARRRIETISKIADRAMEIGVSATDRMTLFMDLDLAAVHFDLDLERLLKAPPFDLAHDIAGIQDNINRETKTFSRRFVPRYAGPNRRAE